MEFVLLEFVRRAGVLIYKGAEYNDDVEVELAMLAVLLGITEEQVEWVKDYFQEWLKKQEAEDTEDLKARRKYMLEAMSDLENALFMVSMKSDPGDKNLRAYLTSRT